MEEFYRDIFVIKVEAFCLYPGPLFVACMANIFLNLSTLEIFPSEVSSTSDWYKPRKGY